MLMIPVFHVNRASLDPSAIVEAFIDEIGVYLTHPMYRWTIITADRYQPDITTPANDPPGHRVLATVTDPMTPESITLHLHADPSGGASKRLIEPIGTTRSKNKVSLLFLVVPETGAWIGVRPRRLCTYGGTTPPIDALRIVSDPAIARTRPTFRTEGS